MIRQLAICSTPDGVIGYMGQLAFQSKLDMSNFVKFTNRTVIIAGRNTAQEMIEKGFKPTATRPLVVISEAKILDCKTELLPHIFYQFDLDSAIECAIAIAKQNVLVGYTIAGGKSVYDEFLNSDEELDAVYLALIEADQADQKESMQVKLKIPANKDIQRVLKEKLGGQVASNNDFEVITVLESPQDTRATVKFAFLYNKEVLDPARVRITPGGFFRLDTAAGVHVFHTSAVASYVRERDRNLIRVFTKGGVEFSIRLDSDPQVNYLQNLIDQNLS